MEDIPFKLIKTLFQSSKSTLKKGLLGSDPMDDFYSDNKGVNNNDDGFFTTTPSAVDFYSSDNQSNNQQRAPATLRPRECRPLFCLFCFALF